MRRPLIIFYSLIIYTVLQVIWWGRLLLAAKPDSLAMILGEGAVFIFIFIIGVYYMHKAIKGERKLHTQQKNFLLSVTHELKSPLASIKLYLETILKRDLDPEQKSSFLKNPSSLESTEDPFCTPMIKASLSPAIISSFSEPLASEIPSVWFAF